MESINFELVLKHRRSSRAYQTYLKKINKEHAAILSAITQGDGKTAKNTIATHLEESLNRYRALLDEPASSEAAALGSVDQRVRCDQRTGDC